MSQRVILDTGPLVAYLKRQDLHHQWAIAQLAKIKPPLLTCEAVVDQGDRLSVEQTLLAD